MKKTTKLGHWKFKPRGNDTIEVARRDDMSRNRWGIQAQLTRASDNATWMLSVYNVPNGSDARPTLSAALDRCLELLNSKVDRESSASRQYYIETGKYLTYGETA